MLQLSSTKPLPTERCFSNLGVRVNLYDANVGRTYQSVGVILQTPLGAGAGGVAPGVYGVYGVIPFLGTGVPATLYTEWSLR